MKIKLILKLLVASLLPSLVLSQDLKEVREVRLESEPISFSVDTEENIYLGLENGSLLKYTAEGDELPRFSLPNQSALTLVEAQNNRRIFFFQRDIQQVTIVDRFATQPKQYPLADLGIDFASIACPSPDGLMWVAENNPPRLKKIDVLRNVVVHEVQTNLGDSISFMKAAHNLVYLSDETGLHIFDQFGNLLSSLDQSVKYFHSSKDEIIATEGSSILQIDPYSPRVVDRIPFPEQEINAIIKLKDKYVVVGPESLTFYSTN